MPSSKTLEPGITSDTWLASLLGQDVYKVDTLPEAGFSAYGRAFCFARVPARDVPRVSSFLKVGFRVVDMTLTFERQPGSLPDSLIAVQPAQDKDRDAILRIAETTFEFSRFHLDPHVPRSTAHRIKREWVANSLAGKRGNGTYAATLNGQPAGFFTTLASSDAQGRKVLVIDLIGVSKDHQRQGVGRALVRHAVQTLGSQYDLIRVGTQAANTPSCRLYEECGFRLADAAYTLHAHFENGKALA